MFAIFLALFLPKTSLLDIFHSLKAFLLSASSCNIKHCMLALIMNMWTSCCVDRIGESTGTEFFAGFVACKGIAYSG